MPSSSYRMLSSVHELVFQIQTDQLGRSYSLDQLVLVRLNFLELCLSSCLTTLTLWCGSTCLSTWRSIQAQKASVHLLATSDTKKVVLLPSEYVIVHTQ